MNYLDPIKFGKSEDFLRDFGDLKTSEQVDQLHAVLAPYLLRRMKEDVDKSIPTKEETIIEIELTSVQKTYYRAVLDRNREFLARGAKNKSNLPKLTNLMMQVILSSSIGSNSLV